MIIIILFTFFKNLTALSPPSSAHFIHQTIDLLGTNQRKKSLFKIKKRTKPTSPKRHSIAHALKDIVHRKSHLHRPSMPVTMITDLPHTIITLKEKTLFLEHPINFYLESFKNRMQETKQLAKELHIPAYECNTPQVVTKGYLSTIYSTEHQTNKLVTKVPNYIPLSLYSSYSKQEIDALFERLLNNKDPLFRKLFSKHFDEQKESYELNMLLYYQALEQLFSVPPTEISTTPFDKLSLQLQIEALILLSGTFLITNHMSESLIVSAFLRHLHFEEKNSFLNNEQQHLVHCLSTGNPIIFLLNYKYWKSVKRASLLINDMPLLFLPQFIYPMTVFKTRIFEIERRSQANLSTLSPIIATLDLSSQWEFPPHLYDLTYYYKGGNLRELVFQLKQKNQYPFKLINQLANILQITCQNRIVQVDGNTENFLFSNQSNCPILEDKETMFSNVEPTHHYLNLSALLLTLYDSVLFSIENPTLADCLMFYTIDKILKKSKLNRFSVPNIHLKLKETKEKIVQYTYNQHPSCLLNRDFTITDQSLEILMTLTVICQVMSQDKASKMYPQFKIAVEESFFYIRNLAWKGRSSEELRGAFSKISLMPFKDYISYEQIMHIASRQNFSKTLPFVACLIRMWFCNIVDFGIIKQWNFFYGVMHSYPHLRIYQYTLEHLVDSELPSERAQYTAIFEENNQEIKSPLCPLCPPLNNTQLRALEKRALEDNSNVSYDEFLTIITPPPSKFIHTPSPSSRTSKLSRKIKITA